jgi:hypothetical protein
MNRAMDRQLRKSIRIGLEMEVHKRPPLLELPNEVTKNLM